MPIYSYYGSSDCNYHHLLHLRRHQNKGRASGRQQRAVPAPVSAVWRHRTVTEGRDGELGQNQEPETGVPADPIGDPD